MKTIEIYKEIESIADRLEEIRILLYNDTEHSANVGINFKNFDDEMFSLQSKIRNLVSEELELFYSDEDINNCIIDEQISKILSGITTLRKIGYNVYTPYNKEDISIYGVGADNNLDDKCIKIF